MLVGSIYGRSLIQGNVKTIASASVEPQDGYPVQGSFKNKMSASVEPHNQYGYLLTLDYTGQAVAGIRAILSQQCWVKSYKLPLAIVEPFSNNSHLGHSHSIWYQSTDFVKFSDYYNLRHFNAESMKHGNPPITSWKNFIQVAPRNIILVTITGLKYPGCLTYKNRCKFRKQNSSLLSPFFTGCGLPNTSRMAAEYLERHNFNVVRKVCFNCRHKILSKNAVMSDIVTRHIFGPYEPKNVTLIVNQWRFSIKLSNSCGKAVTCKNENEVLPMRFTKSPTLFKDAEKYILSNFGSKKIIAIMIRIEWYIITHKKGNDVSNCLQKILDIVRKLQNKMSFKNTKPFLSIDIGAYGSGTFQETLLNTNTSEAKYRSVLKTTYNFVKNLYRNVWTFDDWENSFKKMPSLPNERGYIAALQGTIASKADCLILMGGGHFQVWAVHDYLASHPNKRTRCIEYVCMAPVFKRLLSTT